MIMELVQLTAYFNIVHSNRVQRYQCIVVVYPEGKFKGLGFGIGQDNLADKLEVIRGGPVDI